MGKRILFPKDSRCDVLLDSEQKNLAREIGRIPHEDWPYPPPSPKILSLKVPVFALVIGHVFSGGDPRIPLSSSLCHLVETESGETPRTPPPLVLDLSEKMVFITSVKIDIFCFLFGGNPPHPLL